MIVLVNGVFDLLHEGHKAFLGAASEFGTLIVGLNTDASVRALKGPSRPIQDYVTRKNALLALIPSATVLPCADSDEFVRFVDPDLIVRGWDQTVSAVDWAYPVFQCSPDMEL